MSPCTHHTSSHASAVSPPPTVVAVVDIYVFAFEVPFLPVRTDASCRYCVVPQKLRLPLHLVRAETVGIALLLLHTRACRNAEPCSSVGVGESESPFFFCCIFSLCFCSVSERLSSRALRASRAPKMRRKLETGDFRPECIVSGNRNARNGYESRLTAGVAAASAAAAAGFRSPTGGVGSGMAAKRTELLVR